MLSWRPYYEINLTRLAEAALTVDRSLLVTQYSGEDWAGVDLTLSTSRPADHRPVRDQGRVGPFARNA